MRLVWSGLGQAIRLSIVYYNTCSDDFPGGRNSKRGRPRPRPLRMHVLQSRLVRTHVRHCHGITCIVGASLTGTRLMMHR